ncbi:MAG: M48 family metallopeptidase, partial [Alphaproteobacteria bacterium]
MGNSLTRFAAIASMIAVMTLGAPAEGARISFIRDAEIENTIRTYATPLFTAAGFDADQVRVLIVNDSRLNAFVAGGMNLFLNTGLLLASESPEQVIGVIAHETGHIAGGHLARTQDALRGASAAAILAYVLGAAAIAAGSAEGGAAVIAGGQSIAQQTFLQYSRSQEQAADQFAVSVLDATGQSAEGLLQFLEILGDQEVLLTSSQDPYLRTHPLTRDRIGFLRHHVQISPFSGRAPPPAFVEAFARMQAKLRGFLDPPERTLARYPASDTGV